LSPKSGTAFTLSRTTSENGMALAVRQPGFGGTTSVYNDKQISKILKLISQTGCTMHISHNILIRVV